MIFNKNPFSDRTQQSKTNRIHPATEDTARQAGAAEDCRPRAFPTKLFGLTGGKLVSIGILEWLLASLLIIVMAYDILWDAFLSLLHFLFVFLHMLFEFCEHQLDMLIEHTFHTSPRTTEIIVFYILFSVLSFSLYRIIKALPRWYCRGCERIANAWQAEKARLRHEWRKHSLAGKIKWSSLVVTGSLFILAMALS